MTAVNLPTTQQEAEMTQLVKGMYGTNEFQSKPGLFGLRTGQMSYPWVVRNAGWYNKAGERLGWGDLSAEQMRAIQQGLGSGVIFITIPEHEAFWNFRPGDEHTAGLDIDAPGVDYVAQNCHTILTSDKAYWVGAFNPGQELEFHDMIFMGITREEAARIIKT